HLSAITNRKVTPLLLPRPNLGLGGPLGHSRPTRRPIPRPDRKPYPGHQCITPAVRGFQTAQGTVCPRSLRPRTNRGHAIVEVNLWVPIPEARRGPRRGHCRWAGAPCRPLVHGPPHRV